MRSLRRNARYLPEVALPPALQVTSDFAAAVRHARGGLIVVATPMAGLDPVLRRLGARRRRGGALAVQGLRGRHRLARPRDRAGGGAERPRRRAVRARASRSRWRAASRPRWSRPAATRRCGEAAVEAFHAGALRIYTSADPIGVEVGGAVKNVLAIATGIADGMAARPERARRAGHARPGRDDAPRRRARRRGADLHGPVGPRRPGADGHRRPVAQPHGRPAPGRRRCRSTRILAELGHVAEGVQQRADGAAARACPRRRDADRRRGGAGAGRPARAGAGARAADAPRRPSASAAERRRRDHRRRRRSRSGARPRTPPRRPRCSG